MAFCGDIDEISRARILGWAMDSEDPDAALELGVVVNGRVVGHCRADRLREGLRESPEPSTAGRHAFSHDFDPPLCVFERHEIMLTAEPFGALPAPFARVLPRPKGTPLTPIIVTSIDGSGTTALMGEFARHSAIVVADPHPHEVKLLAYYASALRALLVGQDQERSIRLDATLDGDGYRIGRNPHSNPGFLGVAGEGRTMLQRLFEEDIPDTLRATFQGFIARYYDILRIGQTKESAQFFAEKSELDAIARAGARAFFGRIKEVVVVREPLDELCSAMAAWKLGAAEALDRLKTTLPRLEEIRRTAQADTLFVRYEDLVLQPGPTRRDIHRFLGLSEDESATEASGGSNDSVARWKTELRPFEVEACAAAFQSYRELFGYPALEAATKPGAAARSAAPPIEKLVDIVPGPDSPIRLYLGHGWSGVEEGFIWTNAAEAWINFERSETQSDYLVRILGMPFVDARRLPAQRVGVEVNGQPVAEVTLRDLETLEYRLPWSLVSKRPRIAVRLRLPDAASPLDVTGVGDLRQLGLSLRRLSLFRIAADQPAAEFPEPALPAWAGPTAAPCEALPDMLKFESLGQNCEFGLAQRRCGVDTLGLLRFSNTPLPILLRALRARFEGMGGPGTLEVKLAGNGREYMVEDKLFGVVQHAWVLVGEDTPERIGVRESRRVPRLVVKLIEELALAEKIFVFHSVEPISLADALELAAVLRTFGPNTLLWVDLADASNPPGRVARMAPGLLKGFMDRFAPAENAHDLSLDCWVAVCHAALRLV